MAGVSDHYQCGFVCPGLVFLLFGCYICLIGTDSGKSAAGGRADAEGEGEEWGDEEGAGGWVHPWYSVGAVGAKADIDAGYNRGE